MPRVIIVSAPWGTWIFLKPQVKNPCVSSVHMFLYSEYEVECVCFTMPVSFLKQGFGISGINLM